MMQPPGRIEQLNNFQDSIQSPDGLDRLRALQYIEQALPSSQGLSGMPQVTVPTPQMQPQAPMPVVNRFIGGGVSNTVVATPDSNVSQEEALQNLRNRKGLFGGSGLADVFQKALDEKILVPEEQKETGKFFGTPYMVRTSEGDDLKVFARDQEGILNRALQGGVLEGQRYTPTGGSPTTAVLPESNQTQNTLMGDGPPDQALGQLVNQFSTSMQGQFKDKAEAMAHARENQGGGMVNVYQLSDGSWDYQRTSPGPMPIGMLATPGGPLMAGVSAMKLNPETGNYESSPNNFGLARAGGGQVAPAEAAQGLASFGRYGDNILVHMNPEELDGLASLGNITYNPVTGLPEAFSFKSIFKAVRKLAPIALAIAAPYAFGATTALGIGAASAGGSFFGNLIAGAKPKDALKAGLMSGLFAGGGAYLGGAASGFGGSAATQGGTSAVTSGVSQGGLNISNPAFVADGGSSVLQTGLGTTARTAGNAARGISQFGGTASNAPVASLAGGQSNLIQTSPLSYSSANVPQQYSQSIGNTNQIGLGNANVASPVNVAPVNQFAGGDGLMSSGPVTGTDLTQNLGGTQNIIPNNTGSTSIFAEGGLSKENLSKIGNQIYDKYSTPTGIAKLVAMDLSTPDYEAQYAAEAAAKNRQLTDAGYTVETGFDGQTVIRDSTGVVMPRNLTVQDILNRALGKQKRTNLVARTDYRESTPEERAAMEKSRLAQGGLIGLKHGGEFSGMVPGDGHGMEDNVYMPIVEKGHGSQVGTLAVSPSEYVVDSYTMAALGNGNADAGAKVMDNVVKRVRKKAYGDTKQPNEISGLSALEPMIERV